MENCQLLFLEKEIISLLLKILKNNLVSLLVEGSYASYEHVPGYSDYDLSAFVKKNLSKKEELIIVKTLEKLSKKYNLEVQCCFVLYRDFKNCIENNNKARRFVNNLRLISLKSHGRVLAGKNISKEIPSIKQLAKRNLQTEINNNYLFVTNSFPGYNILLRKPSKWVSCLINLCSVLLYKKGLVVSKNELPKILKKYFPEFKGIKYLKKALRLRKTKKVLNLTLKEKKILKKDFLNFLEIYRKFVMY